ncbi:ATP-binding protein [Nakamurella endophytica]|uniref:HTH luxR-type domain-containing protein n=1 Tax=Nakamurella endophytica TaxID=1748367 RepID=A0A917TD19_9ACTN|nr:AAA family ATPase [Nakamurella endophytica]GGM19094.1 hypothetical protein GCM10011594_43950 [Nakamurella endophytica]
MAQAVDRDTGADTGSDIGAGERPSMSLVPPASRSIHGRDAEIAVLGDWLAGVVRGDGSRCVLMGEAGGGKTSLQQLVVAAADAGAATVLTAGGRELEQDFPFGTVRQLFDGPRGRRASGPAGVLAARLDDARGRSMGTGDTFALFQDLYWSLLDVADQAPVLLVVDDLHWADEPSRRWLEFLGPRLDGVAAGLLLASRPDEVARARWTAGDVTVLDLAPLSADVTARWLTADLGAPVSPRVARTVAELTGGNPLLVRELVQEMRAHGLGPDVGVDRLRALLPSGVRSFVLLRMASLDQRASRLAAAVAVLDRTDLPTAADLAGLDPDAAADARNELEAARILGGGAGPVQFVHPLVRTAVHHQLDPTRRRRLHLRAAELLHGRGARADLVAPHLLEAGDTDTVWATAVLAEAGRQARRHGDPRAAARWLRAAAARPDAGPQVLLEWGETLAAIDPAAAVQPLSSALSRAGDGVRGTGGIPGATSDGAVTVRARAAVALAQVELYRGHGLQAAESLLEIRAELSDDDPVAERVDFQLLACGAVSAAARERLAPWRRRVVAERFPAGVRPGWVRMVAATDALDGAMDGRPVGEVAVSVSRAIHGLETATDPAVAGIVLSLIGLAQLLVDDFDGARAVFDRLVQRTDRDSLADRHADMLAQRASLRLRVGDLAEALAEAQDALDLADAVGTTSSLLPRAAAVVVSVAADQGTAPLAYVLDDIDPDATAFRLLAYSRAELLLAQGKNAAAAEAFEAYGAMNLRLGWSGAASPWRSRCATALRRQGVAPDRSRELVDAELAIARRAGAPRAIGVALRAAAHLRAGSTAELLAEAVTVLQDSPARLELAWALADFGVEHLRSDRRADARAALSRAHDLAVECAAHRLVAQVRPALLSSGGRPRPAADRPPALTRSERVVAGHAAQGLGNRQIARALFVTEKTVEAHLRHAYRKLGIRSRNELAGRLPAGD